MITIHEPYWSKRAFGIAERELVGDEILVQCDFKNKEGRLTHPYIYKMRCNKVKMYPTKKAKGLVLHIVPIEAFETEGV